MNQKTSTRRANVGRFLLAILLAAFGGWIPTWMNHLAARADEPASTLPAAQEPLVFIGTYAPDTEPGIFCFRLAMETGQLTPVGTTSGVKSPSFLAFHPNGRFLYAVSEIGDYSGGKTGAVVAFALDRGTGDLRRLNAQPSGGDGPCHLVVDAAGKNVLVANYGGGSVSVLPLNDDGRLTAPSTTIQHTGSSVTSRQTSPHAHSINLDAQNRFAVAADLGLDQYLIYRFQPDVGGLAPNDPPAAIVQPGAGPRHFDFHPAGSHAYGINELDSTITVFRYDSTAGKLEVIQTVSTLPTGFDGSNSTADIHVHPSGKFVYGSNRGHNSLAMFAVEEASGRLKLIGHEPSGGKVPRNFGIEPSGRWLLSANQDTDNVVVMRIDGETGELTPTGHEVRVPRPVCVKFLARSSK